VTSQCRVCLALVFGLVEHLVAGDERIVIEHLSTLLHDVELIEVIIAVPWLHIGIPRFQIDYE